MRYDPKLRATMADYASLQKWNFYLYACSNSMKFNIGKCSDMTAAPQFYAHYLGGSGTDMAFDFNRGYDEDSSLRRDVDKEIAQAQRAAGVLARNGDATFRYHEQEPEHS